MKKNLLLFLGISIVVFIMYSVSIQSFDFLFIWLGMLCIITLAALFKKVTLFLILSLPYLYFLVFLFVDSINIFTIIIFLVLVTYYIFSFRYAFGLNNNSMNIQFKNIKVPEDKDYSIINYLGGPIDEKSCNGIIVLDNDKYILQIENSNNEVKSYEFNKNDIKQTIIEERPYMKSSNSYSNYEVDYMKSYSIGRMTGNFDVSKSLKMMPSYNISIELNDGTKIMLVTYDSPTIF